MTHTTPTFDNRAYRFRNDDGSESAATWTDSLNTPIMYGESGFTVRQRVRIEVKETAGGSTSGNAGNYQFQFRLNGGTWTNMNAASSPVTVVVSSHYSEGEDCVQRLGGTGGTFITDNDGMTEDGLSGGNHDYSGNEIVETECCFWIIGPPSGVNYSDVVEIRCLIDGNAPDSHTNVATINIIPVNIITITEALSITGRASTTKLSKNVAPSAPENILITENQATVDLEFGNINAVQEFIDITEAVASVSLDKTVDSVRELLSVSPQSSTVLLQTVIHAVTELINDTESNSLVSLDKTVVAAKEFLQINESQGTVALSKIVNAAQEIINIIDNNANISYVINISTIRELISASPQPSSVLLQMVVQAISESLIVSQRATNVDLSKIITAVAELLSLGTNLSLISLSKIISVPIINLSITENLANIGSDNPVTIQTISEQLGITDRAAAVSIVKTILAIVQQIIISSPTVSFVPDTLIKTVILIDAVYNVLTEIEFVPEDIS